MLVFKRRVGAFICVFLALNAAPHVWAAESLFDAVQAALQNHPQVESARVEEEQARETIYEERSGYYPDLSLSASAGRSYGDNATSRGLSVTRGAGYSNTWDGSVTLRQNIFNGFETSARVEAAKHRAQTAVLNTVDVRENLALRTVQTYLNVVRTGETQAMIEKHGSAMASYLERISTAVQEGAADDTQLRQARDILMQLDNLRANYEGQATTAATDYLEITGHMPGRDLFKPLFNAGQLSNNVDQAVHQALNTHPVLDIAALSSEAAQNEIKAERAGLYPDLDSELSYTKAEKRDLIGGESIDAKALVRLNWNFETGGAQLSRIRQKKKQHQATQTRLRDLKRQIERGVRLAHSEYDTAKMQMTTAKEREMLHRNLLQTYQTQFEGAQISLLQLMQAENQYFAMQLERLNNDYRVLNASYAVLASMGGLQSALGVQDLTPVKTIPLEIKPVAVKTKIRKSQPQLTPPLLKTQAKKQDKLKPKSTSIQRFVLTEPADAAEEIIPPTQERDPPTDHGFLTSFGDE